MMTLTRPSAAPVESVTRPRMTPACAASRPVDAIRASTAQHVSNEMRFATMPPREERQDEGVPRAHDIVAPNPRPRKQGDGVAGCDRTCALVHKKPPGAGRPAVSALADGSATATASA